MKPKPLKLRSYSYYKCNCGDYEEGCINCLLNDVKSACEFYLRYQFNPQLLKKEHPQLLKEFVQNHPVIKISKRKVTRINIIYDCSIFVSLKGGLTAFIPVTDYNEWLFKLAFKDIFGKNAQKHIPQRTENAKKNNKVARR